MGENADPDVLTQVEALFKKLEASPENVKEAAISKIRERLMPEPSEWTNNSAGKDSEPSKLKRRSNRGKLIDMKSRTSCQKLYTRGYNLKEVTTQRGRRAKQINYNNDTDSQIDSVLTEDTHCKTVIKAKCYAAEKATTAVTEEAICDSSGLELLKAEMGENVFVVKTLPTGNGKEEHIKNDEKCVKPKNEKKEVQSVHCHICGKVCNDKIDLKHHLKEEHVSHGTYVCQQCGHFYSNAQTLRIHMKRHRGQRDFSCDNCNYRTYTKSELERHYAVHIGQKDERSFVCHHCGKQYAVYRSLRDHVHDVHERTNMHICEECGFTTYRSAYLQVHIRTVHLGNYNSHVCPVCGAHVKQRNAFLEHMRTHTGDRPYKCDKCAASFACAARLTVHQKSVHQPRAYQCNNCSKAFQTKHHLKRHQIIHTKQRPFSCPYCSYSCNAQGNIIKHAKAVHGRPDFSFRKYKRQQLQQKGVLPATPDPEWIDRGEAASQQYLKKLSERLGRIVTINELREKERQRERQRSAVSKTQNVNAAEKRCRSNRVGCHVPEMADHSYVSTARENVSGKVLDTSRDTENTDQVTTDSKVHDSERTVVVGYTCADPANERGVCDETSITNERVLLVQEDGGRGKEIRLFVGTEVSKDVGHVETEPPTLQLVYHSNPRSSTVTGGGARVEVEGGGYITSNFVALSGLEAGKPDVAPTVIVIVDTDQEPH